MFLTLTIADFFAALSYWLDSDEILKTAGALAILCSFFAFYTGFGELLNPIYNKNIIPMGRPAQVIEAAT